MKKILIIDESSLLRDYLTTKLAQHDFEVISARNGLEGSIKLRNEIPDLVITEYYLSRKSIVQVLKEKKENPNVTDVPVILISSKLDKKAIMQVAGYNIKKVFSKPLKLDTILDTISRLLNVNVEIDKTPCIIETHFNDDILFIELARGLNIEKIELLRYKIKELLKLYEVKLPKILIMMANLELSASDDYKLESFFNAVTTAAAADLRHIKVLTSEKQVIDFLKTSKEYRAIDVTNSLEMAMDALIGIKPDQIAHDSVAGERFLQATDPSREAESTMELRFEEDTGLQSGEKEYTIAVVDDDFVIQELVKTVLEDRGWKPVIFKNGQEFVTNLNNYRFDLVFLDLMMPEMNGFEVLQYLKQHGKKMPVIVFSALSRQETVQKVVSFGIKSYLIKPLKPDMIARKAHEAINLNY